MRKLDKAIIWPTYFDTNKSRAEGRRVPKAMAVLSPKILEIKEAVDKLGLFPGRFVGLAVERDDDRGYRQRAGLGASGDPDCERGGHD